MTLPVLLEILWFRLHERQSQSIIRNALLTINSSFRVKAKKRGRGHNPSHAVIGIDEVNDPAVFFPCIRRQAHPAADLQDVNTCATVLSRRPRHTIWANKLRERVGRATTTQSILGMSAPSVNTAVHRRVNSLTCVLY